MASEEVGRQSKREVATTRPLRRNKVGAEGSVEFEAQDDVIERDSGVETAALIKVDYVVHAVERFLLADIRERTAVAHRLDVPTLRRIEAEELVDPFAI